MLAIVPLSVAAAPYAAMVMDARSGEVLHASNADTRLHPASLTKMMTLYIVFEAVENGEIGLDDQVTISRHAASEPPSKLGLRAGQSIRLRYLIRAAAVRSANDAATALAEAVEGSEARFARRMNRTAQAMGMTRTTFRNAHGLTEEGHLSTARDMTVLGRHLIYDYPQYYNLFSRLTADAGVRTVRHTNRNLLSSYAGADGIKTGYTSASGFNLTASAERGGTRIIATVFGGRSSATRNAKVAELLDLGFRRAPTRMALSRPARPPYLGRIGGETDPGTYGHKVRLIGAAAVQRSLRPRVRPSIAPPVVAVQVAEADIEEALRAAQDEPAPDLAEGDKDGDTEPRTTPVARPAELTLASVDPAAVAEQPEERLVERVSTSGGRHWGITVGRYPSEYTARKVLLQIALTEISTLDGSLRKVRKRADGFDANFMGLTRETAELACRRLQAQKITCFMIEPSG
ncbi:MAG: D-alanyl-D-alanine carboxypeptidase [Roseovarius sp.]|nr:D-alanyl-D-alanine carboxypeptidase [Roseovarius sp.]